MNHLKKKILNKLNITQKEKEKIKNFILQNNFYHEKTGKGVEFIEKEIIKW